MPRLVFNQPSGSSRQFELGPGANYAGRGFANDIKLEDPSVSSSHAQILVEDGRVIIRDLGSMNGTFINGLPVQEGILTTGQSIRFGAVELVFQADPPTPPPPSQMAPIAAAPVPVKSLPASLLPEPVMIDGIPVKNPIVASALLAARERLAKSRRQ